MSHTDNCSICYEEFNDPIKLPCNHMYCRKCIVQALEERQSCPICRRLCCNYINQPFPSLDTPETEQHGHLGEPCFVYRIFIHHNGLTQFNFFEKRYVTMITEALQNNLTFIIDPQYNEYCIRVKLVECVPVHQHSIYICNVQNVERCKIVGSSFRDIHNSDTRLKYVQTEPMIDEWHDDCLNLFQKFHKCVDQLIEVLELNENEKSQLQKMVGNKNDLTFETISQKSLELLSTIKMCENGLLKYYFNTDLKGRLEVLIKHYESYLSYYKKQ